MNGNEGANLQVICSVRAVLGEVNWPGRSDSILAAVSGGQDSCALLHALAAMRDEYGYVLCAAHLNHGFRGAEAEGDARFVAQFSNSLDVECTVDSVDVPAMARRLHISAQEAAREARHSFLKRTA